MKLINERKNPKWKKYFKHKENDIDCKHCRFQKADDSIPRKDFKFTTIDKKTKKKTTVNVSQVTLDYDDNDCIKGWYW